MNAVKNKNSRSGFSLTELMVALAIIGILTAVAVPNFLRFSNRAKQQNAKSELSGIYAAEKAFMVPNGIYHANLAYIGYSSDGIPVGTAAGGAPLSGANSLCPSTTYTSWPLRYYSVGFSPTSNASATLQVPGMGTPPNCGANTTYLTETQSIQLGGQTTSTHIPASVLSTPYTTFTAEAVGSITDDGRVDRWTINENRQLVNTEIGI